MQRMESMMKLVKEPNWCNWPKRANARELEDLARMGARCDVWRKFLTSETLKSFGRLKGRIIYFNRYQYFDHLLIEFDCTEKQLRTAINKRLLPEFTDSLYEFKRIDIYEARAWSHIPLNWFVDGLEGFNKRAMPEKREWDFDILSKNEIPCVQFGIRKPLTISRNCFTMTYRIKDDHKKAVMICNYPDSEYRFRGKRWVADGIFPRESTRTQMEERLFAQVVDKCKKHLVTITDSEN